MTLKPLSMSPVVAPATRERLPEAQRCDLLVACDSRIMSQGRGVQAAVAARHVLEKLKSDKRRNTARRQPKLR